jgi:uncharacterized protein YndB with AHSA1/START domain
MSTTTTDRIEKHILLRAPRARVWRALTDSTEFGTWFRAVFQGPFRAGEWVHGRITYPGYEHMEFELLVEALEPERRFTFRWHPNAIEPGVDYTKEPTTQVTFTLEDAEGGTLLRVVESGFDSIPLERRADALKSNESGWSEQMRNIETYLGSNP